MDHDQIWEEWQAWLGDETPGATIWREVVEMLAFRKVWKGFSIVVENAPQEATQDQTFSWWIRWNYARSQGSAIRRQVEVRQDVISLARLIDSVWRYPTVLNRDRYTALHPDWAREEAEFWFDRLAGTDEFINPELPAEHMQELRDGTQVVRGWVNKAVAHADAKGRDAPPLDELDASIKVIFGLFNLYEQLIRGTAVLGDVVMPIWPVVFRVPWIEDSKWAEIEPQVNDAGRLP
jgi:hypothetical protein